MKKIFKNSLYMLVAGALVASCADYNVTDDFHADPDPSIVHPYDGLNAVKSYIDRTANPNFKIGATLDIKEFNKQELVHSAAISNFDIMSFGKTLMSGSVINNDKGVMNFVSMMDLLEHMDEIGGEVYGSPLVANANQPDEWIKTLIAPIEIPVDFVQGKKVNYNDSTQYHGKVELGKASITRYDSQNVLQIVSDLKNDAKANIVEGFEVDPTATYTITFYARSDKDASFYVNFSGNTIEGTATSDGKWQIPKGKWTKVVVEGKSAADAVEGYLQLHTMRNLKVNIQKVEMGYYPDNHRPQTEKEISDTIHYALNAWIDGFMNINKGRIKAFDLVDEPIDASAKLESGLYNLKHSTGTVPYWQDILGNENYAPEVAKIARKSFEANGGNSADLKFFISEIGLENTKKMESLNYWIGIWDQNGAKIDGINAKVNLVCYEDAAKRADNMNAYQTLLANLVKTGKLIRVSNFDVKFVDETGTALQTAKLTEQQRQMLADYNAQAIKAYMTTVPADKQAGLSKGAIVDTTNDPVGLWTPHSVTKDWERNATYKAWCDALSGK